MGACDRETVTRYPTTYTPSAVVLLRELKHSALSLAGLAAVAGILSVAGYRPVAPFIVTFTVLACVAVLGMHWVHRSEARLLTRRCAIDAEIREFDAEVREALSRLNNPHDPR